MSSFHKRAPGQQQVGRSRATPAGPPPIPGTRPSLHSLHLLASSGVPPLDAMIGGGIPAGSVVLILDENRLEGDDDGEDAHVDYTKLLLKYFLAEGVAAGNDVYQASCGHLGTEQLSSQLPEVIESSSSSASSSVSSLEEIPSDPSPSSDDRLKIAWRYRDQQQQGVSSAGGGRSFNLQKAMDPARLKAVDSHSWTANLADLDEGRDAYREAYAHLRGVMEADKYSTNPQVKGSKNLLRICVQDAGLPLWTSSARGDAQATALCRFLLALRALLRSRLGICLVAMRVRDGVARGSNRLARIVECCDYAIAMQAFDKKIRSGGLFKHHHGFLEVVKHSGFNCLQPPSAPPARCVFRSARTRLSVEQIHLPPDVGEDAKREGGGDGDKKAKKKRAADVDF